jgi:hypothetical protein
MNTSKHTPGQPCACCILLRTGEPLESRHGEQPCSDISHIELCPKHAAAPAMYEALQQAQELLRSLVAEEMIHTTELQRVGNCQATMWQALAQAEGK